LNTSPVPTCLVHNCETSRSLVTSICCHPCLETKFPLVPISAYLGFKCFLVYTPEVQQALPDTIVVRLEQVIFHIASFDCPLGTFGIKKHITVLVDSLHKDRQ